MIIWSILNLKDPTVIFLGAVIFWLFLRLIETRKLWTSLIHLALLAPLLYLQYYTRRSVFLITFLAILVSLAIINYSAFCNFILRSFRINQESSRNAGGTNRMKPGYMVFAVIFLICLSIFYLKKMLVVSHQGFVSTGGFIYCLYPAYLYKMPPESVSYIDMISALPKGILHFLFVPFPWKMYSTIMLVAYPQMIAWYLLFPISVFGIFNKFKTLWKKKMVFAVFLSFTIALFSLSGGNIGTDFRIRDALTPVILIFAAKGILEIASRLSQRKIP